MGVLKLSSSLFPDDRVLIAVKETFDRIEPLDIIVGEDPLYRVEKTDMGILFNDETPVVVTFREIPNTIIPAGTNKCELKITDINGIGLENKNYGCKNPDTMSLGHIKSKG